MLKIRKMKIQTEADIDDGEILNWFLFILRGCLKHEDFPQVHTSVSPFAYACLFGKIFKYNSLSLGAEKVGAGILKTFPRFRRRQEKS